MFYIHMWVLVFVGFKFNRFFSDKLFRVETVLSVKGLHIIKRVSALLTG